MKKCIGLILFGLLIVAFSAPVYAQSEFKASGMIDTNWMYYRNVFSGGQIYGGLKDTVGDTTGQNIDKTGQYFNTRGRLKFDATMGKDVSGTIFFEMDSTKWGEVAGGKDQLGKWKGDQAAVEIKNLFFDFGIPYFGIPVPMTARLGLQPVESRGTMNLRTDGVGITLGFKADPVTISPFFFKVAHDKDYASADTDVLGMNVLAKVDKLTLGAYGVFWNMRTYPLNKGTITGLADPSNKGRMYWFGAYAEGKLGPLNTIADIVFDTGKVKPFGANLTSPDVKYSGWAAKLELALPVELFEIGVKGMYASGSDTKKSDGIGLPGGHTSTGAHNSKVGSYVVPPGSEENSAQSSNGVGVFYSNPILGRSPDFTGSSSSAMSRGGIGGTWFASAYASYKLAPWYKMTLLGQYIGDTTKNGNTIGSAEKANGDPRDDKTIGWEVGLFNEIQIYKSLSWGVIGSWLFPGKALEYVNASGRNVKPKAPYQIGSILKYTW